MNIGGVSDYDLEEGPYFLNIIVGSSYNAFLVEAPSWEIVWDRLDEIWPNYGVSVVSVVAVDMEIADRLRDKFIACSTYIGVDG